MSIASGSNLLVLYDWEKDLDKKDPEPWLRDFLAQRDLKNPDGRPLYAYHCSDEEFAELQSVVRRGVECTAGALPSSTAQAFCLFAAEWWNRHHEGGVWKWEPIKEACGLLHFPYRAVRGAVTEGLRRWRRPLLRHGGARMFLVTLACEGGLPLQLLRNDGSALRRYFKHLLHEYHLFRHAGIGAEDLAAEASSYLPRRLQQDVVYKLSGELIEKVWELQREIGESTTPVRDLDRLRPDWRADLPLEVRDETARALLTNLMREASQLRGGRPARLYVRRWLACFGDSWELSARLMLPGRLTEEQWRELLGQFEGDLPWRRGLVLLGPGGDRSPVALVSEITSCESREFRVERLVDGPYWRDANAAATYGLLAGYGTDEIGPLALPGAEFPRDMPWVFVPEADEEGVYRLVGCGSVSTRHPSCVAVFSTEDWEVASGEVRRVGTVNALSATVCEVRGEVVLHPLGEAEGRCRIRTAQERESGLEHWLVGPRERLGVRGSEVFLGVPKVIVRPAGGGLRREAPPEEVEWRPLGAKDWRPIDESCVGDIDLRRLEDGALVFRTRTAVLPADGRIGLHPGGKLRQGAVTLERLGGARVGVAEVPGVDVHVEALADGWCVDFDAEAEPPSSVDMVLHWDAERRLALDVPFPSRGARFLGRQGEVLGDEATVTLQWLAGIRASAVSLEEGERFFVEGTVANAKDVAEETSLYLHEELRSLGPGRFELDLGLLREPLQRLLSSTTELDAFVRLRIDADLASLPPRTLFVERFDMRLEPDRDSDEVTLVSSGSAAQAEAERIAVVALPLWEPGREEPEALERLPRSTEDVRLRWKVNSEPKASGPWLLLGRDGDWHRVRPLRWTVRPGEEVAGELSDLQRAVCSPHWKERGELLGTVLDRLAEEPLADDWSLVFHSLELLHHLPPAVLSVPVELSRHASAAAMALLALGRQDAKVCWNRLGELPFAWWEIPVRTWVRAGRAYRDHLVPLLGKDAAGSELRERMERLGSFGRFMGPVRDWIRVEVLEEVLGQTELAMPAEILAVVLEEERQGLFRRSENRHWPQGKLAAGWLKEHGPPRSAPWAPLVGIATGVAGFKRAVLTAPVAAAWSAAHGLEMSRSLFFEVRRLRDFDPEWFDVAQELALRWTMSTVAREQPEVLR